MLIGQEKLVDALLEQPLENFPRTLLLLGDRGCGKHTLVAEVISPHLKLEVVDITEKLSLDTLLEIQLQALSKIYLIDLTKLTEKQQNAILKFIEEPPRNAYIVLLSNNQLGLLSTILNRCVIYNFIPYLPQVLQQFIPASLQENSDLILKICTTPGQILNLNTSNLTPLYRACLKLFTDLPQVNYYRLILFAQQFNYRDRTDKYDIELFFKLFLSILSEKILDNNTNNASDLYLVTLSYFNKLQNPQLNKEYLMKNFLTNLWKAVNSYK